MGSPTEIYVNPAIAGNSGSGTIGDPYGDLQYALNSVTRDSTNGNRFNIKAGTAEIVGTALDFTTYGTPTLTAPCLIQGYTSAANDGGVGWLSANSGSNQIYNAAKSHVYFRDLEFSHSSNATSIVTGTSDNFFYNCYFHDYTGNGGAALRLGQGYCIKCRFDTMGSSVAYAIFSTGDNIAIEECYIKGVAGMKGMRLASTATRIERNIISDCGMGGILGNSALTVIRNNSILATNAGASARGIEQESTASLISMITGNIVEGYSNTSNIGILISRDAQLFGMNAAYNNTTNYTYSGDKHVDLTDETLAATAFAKSGSDTYANRATYFAPLNVGSVWGGARFGLDKGAIQHTATGGGLLVHQGMNGGLAG